MHCCSHSRPWEPNWDAFAGPSAPAPLGVDGNLPTRHRDRLLPHGGEAADTRRSPAVHADCRGEWHTLTYRSSRSARTLSATRTTSWLCVTDRVARAIRSERPTGELGGTAALPPF